MNHHDIRQTAAEAERHWWRQKVAQRIAELAPIAQTTTTIGHFAQIEVECLEAIIRERTQ